jgi:plasmid stabilization system protein ParE
MNGYSLHPDALADLDEIREYIAHENPDAADRLMSEFFQEFRTLARFPNLGHQRPDLTFRPLRFRIVREYLVAYAAEEDDPVWILAVLHGRRNPRIMAAVLRDRA